MGKHQTHIFATKADLEALLRAIESNRELQFVKTGLFDSPVIHCLPTLLMDPDLGVAVTGDNNHEVDYLVADRNASIEIRAVSQHDGSIKHNVGDQRHSPKTILFRPGGVFNGNCLIAGRAATISDDLVSLAIFKLFTKEIKRQFTKIQSFWVGHEAEALLDHGWRLTTSVKSPPLYDLKR